MDVERLEPGAVERVGRLDVRVDALLAQDRDARAGAQVEEGCRHVIGRVERRRHVQPGVVVGPEGRVLLVGALRVVAQRRDPPRHLVPRLGQVAHGLVERHLAVDGHRDAALGVGAADDRRELADPGVDEDLADLAHRVGAHAEHGAELFGEQCLAPSPRRSRRRDRWRKPSRTPLPTGHRRSGRDRPKPAHENAVHAQRRQGPPAAPGRRGRARRHRRRRTPARASTPRDGWRQPRGRPAPAPSRARAAA